MGNKHFEKGGEDLGFSIKMPEEWTIGFNCDKPKYDASIIIQHKDFPKFVKPIKEFLEISKVPFKLEEENDQS